jgi:CO/xanthine dehydrogenase Mo-binding subunit
VKTVGTSPPRIDGVDKVTGRAKYLDDYTFPNMLHGLTIRSTVAHANIQSIHFDPSFDWKDIVTVTAKDIPGKNVIALIEDDQPALADQKTNHPEEAIALLACEDRNELVKAANAVKVSYDELPVVFDPLEAIRKEMILKRLQIVKGDAASAMKRADLVIEGEYRTGSQEHMYIEPCGVIALPEEGGITVYGSLQCPYYVHKALKVLLNLPDEKVRVIQTVTGGGFGGKEEYPSMIAGHAALLALKANRPVKMVYGRSEDISATTKRHPAMVRHRTGLNKNGKIVAMEIDVVMDGGAYVTLSPVVLSRGIIHATGPYSCDHVTVNGVSVKTNTPPNGAFRGFGAPQTTFAYERQMDKCAKALGIHPMKFRKRNMFRSGDISATGQKLTEVATEEVWNRTMDLPKSSAASPGKAKGRGYSFYWHGAGFTGDGEVHLKSKVGVERLTDGKVKILAASTDIGQGTNTIFLQIAAETLGIPMENISVEIPDTRLVPDSGPTVASRTAMVVGGLVKECCEELLKKPGPVRVLKEYSNPAGAKWNPKTYQGDAYAAYSWAANVADVEVDLTTMETKIEKLWTIVEIGKALHPVLAEGQIEGGVIQAAGWALLEDVRYKDGKVLNNRMTDCLIPTAVDAPPTETILLESPFAHGPFGAKGIGELPMDGPAPAIASAIEAATGIEITEVPVLPEMLMKARRT